MKKTNNKRLKTEKNIDETAEQWARLILAQIYAKQNKKEAN